VLIVGAGPVGLTLAIRTLPGAGSTSLSSSFVLRASRRASEAIMFRPDRWKYSAASALPQTLRSAGLPDDYSNDVCFRTTVTGIEFRADSNSPRVPARYTATEGPDTWWPTPEPPHRINQIYLEPLLLAHAGIAKREYASSTAAKWRTSFSTKAGGRRHRPRS